MDDLNKTLSMLDGILSQADLSDVTAEDQNSFEELPEGFYLSEVEIAEITTSKSSGNPMVKFQLKVVEDGVFVDTKNKDDLKHITRKKTKNRKIFKYFVLKDAESVKKFASAMLKFEGETPDQPILEKECFLSSELLNDALDVLVGLRIYVQISTSENTDGSTSTWTNFTQWKVARKMGLPD